jgi:hypothetical protein
MREPKPNPLSPTREDPFAEGPEAARARRFRNVALAAALLVFVGLVFAVSILKMGGHG